MSWVVDTCLLIDVLEDDPEFGQRSARLIDEHGEQGLLVCPVTYAELAPAFQGARSLQDEFLGGIGIDWREDWTLQDTLRSHSAWYEHIAKRRRRESPKRPLADILIGSFSTRFEGLLTRNAADFREAFEELEIRTPDQA